MSNSLVTMPGGDYFYMHLRAINNTNHDQPCRIQLRDDMTILDDPSKYSVGILAFTASLGASSLLFTRPDNEIQKDRRITYRQLYSPSGNYRAGDVTSVSREVRTLQEKTVSITDLFDKLNPKSVISQRTGVRFQLTGDGRVMLSYVDPDFAQIRKQTASALHDSATYTRNSEAMNDFHHCTEVTLSEDLLNYFDMNGAPVERIRHNDVHGDEILDLLEFMGYDVFGSWTELFRFEVTARGSGGTTNRNKQNFFEILDYASDEIEIGNLGPWLAANSLTTQQVLGWSSDDFILNEIELCVYRADTREPCGTFPEWRFENFQGELCLTLRGFIEEQIQTGDVLRIDDPFLRTLASIYQSALTPKIEIEEIRGRDHHDKSTISVKTPKLVPEGRYLVMNPSPVIHQNIAIGFDELGVVQIPDNQVTINNPKNQYMRPHAHTTDRMRNLDRRLVVGIENNRSDDGFQAAILGMTPHPGNPTWLEDLGMNNGDTDNNQRRHFRAEREIPQDSAIEPKVDADSVVDVLGSQILGHEAHLNVNEVLFFYQNPYIGFFVEPLIYKMHDAMPFINSLEEDAEPTDLEALKTELDEMEASSERVRPNMLFETLYQSKFSYCYQQFQYKSLSDLAFKSLATEPTFVAHEKDQTQNGTMTRQIFSVSEYYREDPRRSAAIDALRKNIQKFLANLQVTDRYPLPSTPQNVIHVSDEELQDSGVLSNQGLEEDKYSSVYFYFRGGTEFEDENGRDPQRLEDGRVLQVGRLGENTDEAATEIAARAQQAGADFYLDKTIEVLIEPGSSADLALLNYDFRKRSVCYFEVQEVGADEPDEFTFHADVIAYNNKRQDGSNFRVLTLWWDEFTPEMGANIELEPMTIDGSSQEYRLHRGADTMVDHQQFWFQIQEIGQKGDTAQRQNIQHHIARPNVPIKLFPGDRIRSTHPCVDQLQEFSQLAVVSNSGFLFRPEINQGFTAPVMLSVPLNLQLSTSLGPQMTVQGVNVTPAADVYYTARGAPEMHPLMSNLPLREGQLEIQLESRDGTKRELAMLKPRGRFDCRLFFMRKP